MTVTLNVSPLSKKILIRDFGSNSIRITKRNPLYSLLNGSSEKSHEDLLTETITLEVVKPPKYYHNAGINLHRFHMHKLMSYLHAQVLIGVCASVSLRNFYKYYSLTEDDYNQDSAYRRWQRFLSAKKHNSVAELAQNKETYVLPDVPKLPLLDLEKLVADFCLNHASKFIGSKNQVKTIMFRQLRIWIYYDIGGYSLEEIASLFKLTTNNTCKSRLRFMHLVRNKKMFPYPSLS